MTKRAREREWDNGNWCGTKGETGFLSTPDKTVGAGGGAGGAYPGVLKIWYCSNFRLRKIRSVETPAALCRSVNMVHKLEAQAGRLERHHVT